MTPGLPGTGIGGLFYLLLVVLLPLREAVRDRRGVRDIRRWRAIGGLLALASGIVAALWLEAWLLFEVLGLGHVSLGVSAEQAARMARAASVATLASLALVLVVIALLRLFVRRPAPAALRCAAVPRVPAVAILEHHRARPVGTPLPSRELIDKAVPVGPPLDPAGRRDLLSA